MPGQHCAGGVPVVKVRDIFDGRIDESDLLFTHPSIDGAYKRSRLAAGDLLITIRGTTGRVAFTPSTLAGANITQDTARIRVKGGTSSDFVYFALQSEQAQQQIALHTIGQAVKGINIRDVRRLTFPIPKKEDEQRAIARALSDVDAVLAGLDRLIAKKRDLKQAAMQQLLTGQTRMPGFTGKWKVMSLGELFEFSGGYAASRDELSSEGHRYLHYGDIHGSSKTSIDTTLDAQDIPRLDVSLKQVSPDSLLHHGDVVFVDASEDDEGTTKHVVVSNQEGHPFIAGLHTIVAKPRTADLTHEYRHYCFQTEAVRKQFLFYAVGTKVSGISKTNIAKVFLPIPSTNEQVEIASMLTDMESELAALHSRRDKTRALKQAMMQELLTGRIRLI
ncbi:restriction endonuclease subunit S [Pseudorhodoferax aquiterrae]|nr:restriction endonuclease subunit S [Pseudorhodoferax aquiterrae]